MVKARKHLQYLVLAAVLLFLPSAAFSMVSGDYVVRDVIDGDTIILDNGAMVRYVGVDTPEMNEPFYLEAKARNATMVNGMLVRVLVCGAEPFDRYGRVLAWVSVGAVQVNETLLREGLARVLSIPPCGLARMNEYKAIENEARAAQRGIWGPFARMNTQDITPYEAHMHIGEMVRVRGRVFSVDAIGKSWYLDFRSPNGFKAVIIPRAVDEFDLRRRSILDFVGREVEINGIITERNGRPEILIDSSSRIE